MSLVRNRDGSAETGVSMFTLPLAFWCGFGRAKGLGGPVAPAERSVVAEGDGGGKTWRGLAVWVAVSAPFRGEASPVALPPFSELSSGICTLRRGLGGMVPDFRLLDREGGVNVVSGIETCGRGFDS